MRVSCFSNTLSTASCKRSWKQFSTEQTKLRGFVYEIKSHPQTSPSSEKHESKDCKPFWETIFVFICIIFLTYFSFLESLFAICFFIGLFKILTTILLGQLIANAKKRKQVNPHNLFFSRRQNTLCSSWHRLEFIIPASLRQFLCFVSFSLLSRNFFI